MGRSSKSRSWIGTAAFFVVGLALAGPLVLIAAAGARTGTTGASGATRSTNTASTVAPTTTTTTASPPRLTTTNFVCSNGSCTVGPGDTGIAFEAGLIGTGGPAYSGPECNSYLMKVSSGALPPGLQLGEPICEWEITGTPTAAGTWSFRVRIEPQLDGFGHPRGPAGFQQLSITIGSGTADRLLVSGAVWVRRTIDLVVSGFDVNAGATYTWTVTATGQVLGTFTERPAYDGGDSSFRVAQFMNVPPSSVTVSDSLGSSVTVPVVRDNQY
jgi:hypothetical protein